IEEGFNGWRVATAHGHAGNINVAVADRLHCEVFLDRALSAHGELRNRTAWSGLGHLSAGVGVHLGVKHEHIDVSAGAEDVIESSKANVVRPSVAANDPPALEHQTVSNCQEIPGIVRVHSCEPPFQFGDSLTLSCDAALF